MDGLFVSLAFYANENWRDILKPIRDGFDNIRDRLPGQRRDEAEERKARLLLRRRNTLKGFAYFESFEELLAWTPDQVDVIQKSTFPLLQRPEISVNVDANKSPAARIMICHDFSGAYHPYESNFRSVVEDRSFTLDYAQHVDTFIYFSHRLVTIPPPAWTNTLHRNGILSLGTFIIEPQTIGHEEIIRYSPARSPSGRYYPVADKLARMAKEYGFDGWLINIEKGYPRETWEFTAMGGFLRQLRELMGPTRKLVWYDALTGVGKVKYQNALTYSNVEFFDACGDILINYNWDPKRVEESLPIADEVGEDSTRLHFGIDVWAQNRPQDRLHPRTTYPPPAERGGGTNTGVAVAECADQGVSACVFGPAWCWEHFTNSADAITITRAVWEGISFPKEIECRCYEGSGRLNRGDHTTTRVNAAITKNAMEFAAGTDSFFWTDFHTGYIAAEEFDREGDVSKTTLYSQLGSQSVLPHSWRAISDADQKRLCIKIKGNEPGLTIALPPKTRAHPAQTLSITLYKLRMLVPSQQTKKQSLKVTIDCELLYKTDLRPLLYIKLSDDVAELLDLSRYERGIQSTEINMGKKNNDIYITELGIKVEVPEHRETQFTYEKPALEMMQIYNLSIMLHDSLPQEEFELVPLSETQRPSTIDVRCEERTFDNESHVRLCWGINDIAYVGPHDGIHHPRSHITGAMSHFEVYIGNKNIDRAYGLEMVLPEDYLEQWHTEEGLTVRVDCVRFGGMVYKGDDIKLSAADAEWIVVETDELKT
jgi:hypothetical protein